MFLKIHCLGRKTFSLWTIRTLKMFQTSGPDVMSGRALPDKPSLTALIYILWLIWKGKMVYRSFLQQQGSITFATNVAPFKIAHCNISTFFSKIR